MRGHFLIVIMLGLSWSAWGQGGTRGGAAQQAGAGRGGDRGGGGPAGSFEYETAAAAGVAVADAQPVETRQKITVNGEALAYTARAGYLALRNSATGQSSAHIFFTSYTREGVGNASARPLIFFLGGAPGVAAAWQDFGGLGPKRMKWMKDGAGLPPYGWAENPYTILGQADLVFVSPVGTAYSRADQPGRAADFWTTAADTALLGGFVRGFTAAYGRRNSPLFVAGEDFGTARAAGVAGYLIERHIPVQGVILLSIAPSADSLAGDTRHLTLLPSLAMAAWWHKKLEAELQAMSAAQIAEQARQFCAREYLHALYKGDRMTPEERAKVVAALARLTGLSKAFIVSNDLRIPLERFVTELLRDQKRTLSTADARAAGFSPAGGRGGRGGGTSPAATDYNQGSLAGGFLTAYEAYLRGELNFTGPGGVFYLSGGGVGAFTSTGSDEASLASAFARNPRLRLFVGVNLYDLAAPFYAAEFTLAHLSVSPEVRAGNINTGHYEAGQMAYVDDRALAGLHRDLVRFINETMSPERQ